MQNIKQTNSPVNSLQINISLSSNHPYYINNVVGALKAFCIQNWSQEPKQVFLPHSRKVISVLRSPHVDKKAQDHFEQITFKRVLKLTIPNTSSNMLKLCHMEATLLGLKGAENSVNISPFQSVLIQFEIKSSTRAHSSAVEY